MDLCEKLLITAVVLLNYFLMGYWVRHEKGIWRDWAYSTWVATTFLGVITMYCVWIRD